MMSFHAARKGRLDLYLEMRVDQWWSSSGPAIRTNGSQAELGWTAIPHARDPRRRRVTNPWPHPPPVRLPRHRSRRHRCRAASRVDAPASHPVAAATGHVRVLPPTVRGSARRLNRVAAPAAPGPTLWRQHELPAERHPRRLRPHRRRPAHPHDRLPSQPVRPAVPRGVPRRPPGPPQPRLRRHPATQVLRRDAPHHRHAVGTRRTVRRRTGHDRDRRRRRAGSRPDRRGPSRRHRPRQRRRAVPARTGLPPPPGRRGYLDRRDHLGPHHERDHRPVPLVHRRVGRPQRPPTTRPPPAAAPNSPAGPTSPGSSARTC